MEVISRFLAEAVNMVWGLPLVITLVGAGLYLTIILGVPQLKGFWHAIQVILGKYDDPNDPGEISHFQALCTALSATVGLGNIAGVAVAIHMGGPGAVFWMVLTGLVGMSTKFSECSLAVMYRDFGKKSEVLGGPMYYITRGLGPKWKPLAVFFAVACMGASFGAGNMFQTNQVASIMLSNFDVPPMVTGLLLAFFTGLVILGGIKRIGKVTSFLVPFMGGLYILGALVVIGMNIERIPELFATIFSDAFSGTAAGGAFTGIALRTVIVQGVRRACFSNEAGQGSSPIAHAAATTNEPIREGVVALLEPFIDTVVICTMTALVILISGEWTSSASGVELTAKAFDSAIPGFGKYFVPLAVGLFAYSTLLSWSYYGEMCTRFLFDSPKSIIIYKIVFCVLAFTGAMWKLGPVLDLSDILLGLLVVPNLIAVLLLSPKLKKEATSYFDRLKSGEIKKYR